MTTTTLNTYDHSFDAAPPTIPDIILPPQLLALLTPINTTCPTPVTSVATSDYLPLATSNTFAPSTNDGVSVLTCPHRNRIFTSSISLVGHLRLHRTKTYEFMQGAPTLTAASNTLTTLTHSLTAWA
ncbi:unnamed protein product [Schistocephalus solidus]|uniref:C2H2-type domain-containing protein n=1 Tax=Schistocephalus solidus TaxID=70667 RepID=A0A183TL75_SCHSO|nr:unnamed protein product [Schistocephalus solidus]